MKAISYPFRLAPGKLAMTRSYEELVRGQVIDGLMTNLGERVMRPNYGCDVQAALFDPSDELVRRDAAGIIKERLQAYVPRCLVLSVQVDLAPEPYVVYVNIRYKPTLYATDTTLSVPITSEFVNRSRIVQSEEGAA